MRKFEVKQGELTIEGRFERPAFSLLRAEGANVVELLYAELNRYGITPNDITFGQTGSLADRYVLFYMPRIAAGVKVSVAKLEVGFNDLARVTFADVSAIALAAFNVLSKPTEQVKLTDFVTTLNVHGTVDDIEAVDFLEPYLGKAPDGLGPSTGGAAGFYYGAEGPRQTLSIIMDGSVLYARGIYVRVTAGFDGRQITYAELLDVGRDTVRRAFASLGLETTLDLASDR